MNYHHQNHRSVNYYEFQKKLKAIKKRKKIKKEFYTNKIPILYNLNGNQNLKARNYKPNKN